MTYAREDFCGAGGASCGLLEAGYESAGYDSWDKAIETQRANGHQAWLADLSTHDPPAPPRPWLYWASPPCQPFSAAGAGEGEFDDRDGIPWWLRILGRQLPEVAIMENVRGLTFEKHSAYLAGMLAAVRALGYRCEWKILNAADYGVPQTRDRFVLIARRDGGPIVWPAVTHTEEAGLFTARWVSMAEALGWGAGEVRGNSNRPDQRPAVPTTRPAPTVTAASGKSNLLLNTGRDWQPAGTRADAQTIEADQPAPTVTAVAGQWQVWEPWHAEQHRDKEWTQDRPATTVAGRALIADPGANANRFNDSTKSRNDGVPVTLDELAALQDFPPGYTFVGNKTDRARLIGNAVPRTLARLLAEGNRPL